MKYILWLGLLIFLFVTSTVASRFNINNIGIIYSFIFGFLFLIKLVTDKKNNFFIQYHWEFKIMIIGLFIVLIKLFLRQSNQIFDALNFFIMPMILSFLLGVQSESSIRLIRRLVLIFYIVECVLSMFEYAISINFFPYLEEQSELQMPDIDFRSTSLLGNPLANALCVSTIMGFIITSSMKKVYKIFYIILGIFALMSFNSRGAFIIWGLIFFIYFVKKVLGMPNVIHRLVSILTFIFLCFFTYYLMVKLNLGSRIINGEIYDGNAKTRIDSYDAFDYLELNDLWFGDNQNYLKIGSKLGVGSIENSYISLIIKYGVIMFFMYVVYCFRLIKGFIRNYIFIDKFVILSSFVLVGSTNNGLAGTVSWFFFVISFYSFSQYQSKIRISNG